MSSVVLHPVMIHRLIDLLPDCFHAEHARDINLCWHVELVGQVPAQFTVEVANKTCAVREQLLGDADCHLVTDASSFRDLCEGRQSAELATLTGQLKTDSLTQAMKFQQLFCA